MNITQVVNVVEIAIHKLPHMESLYSQAKDQAEKMQCTIERLANYIGALEHKISLLDKTALSCEQECKRTEQKVQELNAQKDRLEKLIANVLNRECHSKLQHFVKENVKAVLYDNKILVSAAFTALLQTLKCQPRLANLVYNIPNANDGEHDKDNNKIAKYLEANKDRILNLTEKNYENLIEALTKNTIDIVASASSSSLNSTLSLPQSSSSAFPNSYDQIDTFRIEDSESIDNSKGDIAD
jgi:hypothetical protein